jgi:hypothetical protein
MCLDPLEARRTSGARPKRGIQTDRRKLLRYVPEPFILYQRKFVFGALHSLGIGQRHALTVPKPG